MHVVCTAGHVDHGKSTLVRALTGIEPDRFDEERRRGLTIDIGFAWTDVDGETIAFVDLPGHERFIANMLAGAGAVRLALFVVAADEGWMPQSSEHLAILDLLGVSGGVIAVTRADLVDEETQELAIELVREEVQGTALAEAPILAVSARTGEGLDELRSALAALVRSGVDGADRAQERPRLWVDRSFSVAGAGTIVTGTLTGGSLRVDDEVMISPSGLTTRIRGLQQLQQTVNVASPGRVAINLVGVPRDAVQRGDAVLRGPWVQTGVVDARARSLGGRPLQRRGAWHLHVGSAERVVTVEPWSDEIGPSGGMVRLRFDPALPLMPGDAFVLREAGARETVGGGRVLDVAPPPRRRGRAAREQRLRELERRAQAVAAGDRAALAEAVVAECGAVEAAALDAETGGAVPQELAGRLAKVGPLWADPVTLDHWRAELTGWLSRYHAEHPLAPGATRDQVRDRLVAAGCPSDHVVAVERFLVEEGTVATDGPAFRLPDHRISLDDVQQEARDRLLAVLETEEVTPPEIDVAIRDAGASPELLRALEFTGDVVRLNERLVFSRGAWERAIEALRKLHGETGPFTTAEARERLGTTRKYIIPLLEEFDRRGVTRRLGDRREMR